MKKTNPLVSIITISFNSSSTIKDTIESVINQSYKNIEYIIVDGKSTDGTLEIIQKYKPKIIKKGIVFRLLSEKDNGIADAWNKGLNMINGSIIGMLNADDWYDNKAIENIVKCINPNEKQLTYGICHRVNKSKNVVEIMGRNFKPNRVYLNFGFSHTTCFITQKLIDEVGKFNLNYNIAVDTDFLLRCNKRKIAFIKCSNITFMRLGGVSTKFKKEALLEYQKALKNNGYNTLLIWIFGVLKKGILLVK